MAKVNMSTNLAVPAQTAWAMIGGFGALAKWHPAVAKCDESREGGATMRRLTLAGGGTILERLEQKNDKERTYTYSIVEGPLPVADYTSTLRVREGKNAQSCTVEWSSDFEPKGASESEAVKVMQGVYAAGFENLKKMFGG